MTEPASGIAAFAAARAAVVDRIERACARGGRDPATVTLVAVSKTVETERVRDAVAAGLTVLGENRVQEAERKAPGIDWRDVASDRAPAVEQGPAGARGVRRDRVGRFRRAGGADRPAGPRGRRGPRAGRADRYPILLQVNVDDDPAKAGFAPRELPAALEAVAALDAIEVRGLMTIGRFVTDPEAARPTFRALRALSGDLRARAVGAVLGTELSMGMTDDFEVAVEEGSTIVRVGRALFGERPHAHDGVTDHQH